MYDKNRLIAALVERHGIRLDQNDPAFLLVDLNWLVLQAEAGRFTQVQAGVLDQLTKALHDLANVSEELKRNARPGQSVEARQAPPLAAVTLTPHGRASVAGAVDGVLNAWTPKVAAAVNEASVLGDVQAAVQRLERSQAAFLQQQRQEGINWIHVGAIVAGCLVSAVIGGLVVAWAVKPASAGGQGLPPDAPAATSIEAPRKEPR